jgi:hypothetical protein
MPIYLIDVHERTHTCPANPESHVVDTRRTIVSVTPTGECLSPITLPAGAVVACGELLPDDKRCAHCTVTIEVRNTTREHLGDATDRPAPEPLPDVPDRPCPVCGEPMAGFLDRHLLCDDPDAPVGRDDTDDQADELEDVDDSEDVTYWQVTR